MLLLLLLVTSVRTAWCLTEVCVVVLRRRARLDDAGLFHRVLLLWRWPGTAASRAELFALRQLLVVFLPLTVCLGQLLLVQPACALLLCCLACLDFLCLARYTPSSARLGSLGCVNESLDE